MQLRPLRCGYPAFGALNPMISILIREKRGRFSTQTHRGEGQMKTETEIGEKGTYKPRHTGIASRS